MIPRFDAETVLRAIGEHRATLMDGVPTAYYYLLAHPDFDVLRPVEPDALLGRRPDAAGGQGDRVHRAHRLPDPRGLGHDGARRRHQREPGDRAQQARHDRHPLPRQRDARRRHHRPHARDAGRRARRADVPRAARDARLLRQRGGHGRDDRAGRLAAHRRRRHDGRGRLLHDRRPDQGHDPHRRLQRLPGRDRTRPVRTPGRRARRGRRESRTKRRASSRRPTSSSSPQSMSRPRSSSPTVASISRHTRSPGRSSSPHSYR